MAINVCDYWQNAAKALDLEILNGRCDDRINGERDWLLASHRACRPQGLARCGGSCLRYAGEVTGLAHAVKEKQPRITTPRNSLINLIIFPSMKFTP